MNLFVYIIIPFFCGKKCGNPDLLVGILWKNLTHLWELAEITVATLLLKTNPTNIKEGGKGTFFVIVPQDKVEHVISQESKDKLKDKQFIIHTPIEYNAMRTIIIRHLDKVMAEFTDKEIADNIEQTNSWAKVDTVVKLMNSDRMLKVRFHTTDMAERALRESILVIYQNIHPRHIENEIFIRLTPCYNCYGYDHKTQSCPKEKQTICANCGQIGHHQNTCTSENSKCINCDGAHKTLAAVCPVRKDLIKSRGKEVRDRSKSRSMARISYTNTVTNNNTLIISQM